MSMTLEQAILYNVIGVEILSDMDLSSRKYT